MTFIVENKRWKSNGIKQKAVFCRDITNAYIVYKQKKRYKKGLPFRYSNVTATKLAGPRNVIPNVKISSD